MVSMVNNRQLQLVVVIPVAVTIKIGPMEITIVQPFQDRILPLASDY
jgi:hypothetical protein